LSATNPWTKAVSVDTDRKRLSDMTGRQTTDQNDPNGRPAGMCGNSDIKTVQSRTQINVSNHNIRRIGFPRKLWVAV
jgi:hypothetical protein